MFVDSHCHIAGPEFAEDLDAVVERARAGGIVQALVILAADDQPELDQATTVLARWPEVRFSVGVHPHAAGAYASDPEAAATLVDAAIARQPFTRGLGEIGLDYHYDFAPRDVQQLVFAAQLRLARRLALPVVIHTREADEDTLRMLKDEAAGDVGGVLHCFTGDRAMARRALDLGFHISLGGIVTFPRAAEMHEVARSVPLDRLLIETDSPFLSPVPFRGTRNEPARVVRVAEAVAALRGMTALEVGEAALANFRRLFAA